MNYLLKLEFLFTVIIFCGIAQLYIVKKHKKYLKGEAGFIGFMGVIGFVLAYWDSIALRWGAYKYNAERTMDLKIFGGQFDTYIFMTAVAVVVSSATIVYMKRELSSISKDKQGPAV